MRLPDWRSMGVAKRKPYSLTCQGMIMWLRGAHIAAYSFSVEQTIIVIRGGRRILVHEQVHGKIRRGVRTSSRLGRSRCEFRVDTTWPACSHAVQQLPPGSCT